MLKRQEKIDRYLDGKMELSEQLAFEEAMKNDATLAEDVALNKDLAIFFKQKNVELEKSLSELGKEYFSDILPPNTKKRTPNKLYVAGVMMFIFLLSSAGFLYFMTPKKNISEIEKPTQENVETLQSIDKTLIEVGKEEKDNLKPVPNSNIPENNPIFQPSDKKTKNTEKPIAKINTAFDENPLLENLISENIRSNEIKIVMNEPKKEFIYKRKDNHIFMVLSGTTTTNEAVELVIYNNQTSNFEKNYTLLTTNIKSTPTENNQFELSFNAKLTLKTGLYYYILRTEKTNNVLHIAKFYVK